MLVYAVYGILQTHTHTYIYIFITQMYIYIDIILLHAFSFNSFWAVIIPSCFAVAENLARRWMPAHPGCVATGCGWGSAFVGDHVGGMSG